MKKNGQITSLISRLAEAESAFMRAQFLAPVTGSGSVQVRIGGVICRMRVRPFDFTGWGVFQPTSYTFAKLVREASLLERQKYLALFPAVRLTLIERLGTSWLAVPARVNDARLDVEGEVLVHAVDDAELLDTIVARFDGAHFWFDATDAQADPSIGSYLRESMIRMTEPRLIDRPGVTPEQRIAYAAVYARRIAERLKSARASGEGRIRAALEHAGATMSGFAEVADSYRVTYTVGRHRHVSILGKQDLSVQSAGICLSGQDAIFDLASLVSVLRKGHEAGEIYHGLQV